MVRSPLNESDRQKQTVELQQRVRAAQSLEVGRGRANRMLFSSPLARKAHHGDRHGVEFVVICI